LSGVEITMVAEPVELRAAISTAVYNGALSSQLPAWLVALEPGG